MIKTPSYISFFTSGRNPERVCGLMIILFLKEQIKDIIIVHWFVALQKGFVDLKTWKGSPFFSFVYFPFRHFSFPSKPPMTEYKLTLVPLQLEGRDT